MKNKNIEVLVNDKPIKQYVHEGLTFVEGRKGVKYSIKVKNPTGRRVVAVLSVDGLSVLDGKPAKADSQGYIINAYQTITIQGFRVDANTVNLFEFSGLEQSYAAKSPTGEQSTQNCGVIGVRLYAEKVQPIHDYWMTKKRTLVPPVFPNRPEPYWRFDEPSRFNEREIICKSAGNSELRALNFSSTVRSDTTVTDYMSNGETARGMDMGTKFSDEQVTDKVTFVEFERGGLVEENALYYASRSRLEELGVDMSVKPVAKLPSAFKDSQFCQPPR